MSLKTTITKAVFSETLFKVVSYLSSISSGLTDEKIKSLVETKTNKLEAELTENNDLAICVRRTEDLCSYKNITSLEKFNSDVDLREDPVVSELIDFVAEGIARNLSPVIYELRTVIPEETTVLATEIYNRMPSDLSSKDPTKGVKVFSWGKLKNASVQTAAMLVAQDKAGSFKDGVVRQHDASNILRRVPYGTLQSAEVNADVVKSLTTVLAEEIESSTQETKPSMKSNMDIVVASLTSERSFLRTITSLKETLQSKNISESVIAVTELIDAFEDVTRLVTTRTLNKNPNTAALATRLFTNAESFLVNLSLIRASMIYHKVHTLQGKLVLSKSTIQESTLPAFKEAGGTDQLIKDYFTYMDVTKLVQIPNNGLSLDVVLNSSAKAKSVVENSSEAIIAKEQATKAKALMDALQTGLIVHYEKNLHAGIYHPTLKQIHNRQLNRAMQSLSHLSVDDIALEYLVTLRNSPWVATLYKSINKELHSLVETNTDVSKEQISEALCLGVVSVVYDTIVQNFSTAKKAA